MDELDPKLRELVDAYVEETATSPAQVEAALHSVTSQVGAAGGAGAASTGMGLAAKASILAVVLGGAALMWPRAPEPAHPPPEITSVVTAEPEPLERAPVRVEAEPAPVEQASPAPAVVEEEAVEVDPIEPVAHKRAKRAPSPSSRQAHPAAAESLAAELELMRSARAALRSGDASRALSLVRDHAKTYPKSAFIEERSSTEVMALCALGRTKLATRKAKKFRKRFPGSAFEAGLAEACEE